MYTLYEFYLTDIKSLCIFFILKNSQKAFPIPAMTLIRTNEPRDTNTKMKNIQKYTKMYHCTVEEIQNQNLSGLETLNFF